MFPAAFTAFIRALHKKDKGKKYLHKPEKNEMAIKMMCYSFIQFSAVLSMPLSNSVTVTTYDNLAQAELFTFYTF